MVATLPSPAPASRFGSLLVVALVLLLAWQLAHWTWVFVAPRNAAAVPAPDMTVDLALAARLFGGSLSGGGSTTVASASSLRLKGVVAPTPGIAASAIFNTGSGRDVSVYLDGEVQPGVKLVEVLPGAAVVSRGGVRERIELDTQRTARSAVSPQAGRPVGFRVNVARTAGNQFAFSRRELDEALKDPAQLSYLGRIGMVPDLGVKMEDAPAGSLAQKLGLQPGDVIKRVNGQAVASTGDLARLYTQFSLLTSIQAEVLRGGATVQLTYAIQP